MVPNLLITTFLFANRELRLKEEIEKYRQERPKIQQQFSDLKVCFLFIKKILMSRQIV